MASDLRPAVFQNGPAKLIDFALKGNFEARKFQTKVKPSNSTEE